MKQLDFLDDWSALGFVPRKASSIDSARSSRDTQYLTRWLDALSGFESERAPLLGLLESDPQVRASIYSSLDEIESFSPKAWIKKPVIDDWIDRLSRLRVKADYDGPLPAGLQTMSWEWLWALIHTEHFLIEEPLLGMAEDSRFLSSHVTRLLLHLRFFVTEGEHGQAADLLTAFLRWVSRRDLSEPDHELLHMGCILRHGEISARLRSVLVGSMLGDGHPRILASDAEQTDVFLFLLSLAAANGIFDRVVFAYDDVEQACALKARRQIRDLQRLIQAASRWSSYVMTPIGFLVGMTPQKMGALRRLNPVFAAELAVAANRK